jgi:hypothetical protein
MSRIAAMNVQIFTLLVVCSSFMLLWDGDARHQQTVLAARKARQAQQQLVAQAASSSQTTASETFPRTRIAAVLPGSDSAAVRDTSSASINASPAAVKSTSSDSTGFIPVPESLSAGTWSAYDQSGRVLQLTIRQAGASASQRRMVLQTAPDGRQWCFIRVD